MKLIKRPGNAGPQIVRESLTVSRIRPEVAERIQAALDSSGQFRLADAQDSGSDPYNSGPLPASARVWQHDRKRC